MTKYVERMIELSEEASVWIKGIADDTGVSADDVLSVVLCIALRDPDFEKRLAFYKAQADKAGFNVSDAPARWLAAQHKAFDCVKCPGRHLRRQLALRAV